jgi:hypothetical protein
MKTFKQFLEESIEGSTKSGKRAYKDYTNFKGSDDKNGLKKIMDRELKKFKDSDHKDPKSYPKDWPADKKYKKELESKGKDIPKSKYTDAYHRMYGESLIIEQNLNESNVDAALKNKAEKTGIKTSILRAVLNRGLAAWRQHHRPGATQVQWAMGRVNSFITGGGARKADQDLWDKRND